MPARVTVLLVEDEIAIRRVLRSGLPPDEFRLVEAETAKEALTAAATHNPDVVLLDLGLPDGDGIAVTRKIRELQHTPIIVLSARDQERDKVDALDAGADDYLTKPFGMGELLARIRVALRHVHRSVAENEVLEAGPLSIDVAAHEVWLRGSKVHLTPTEYKLLVTLVRNAGRVVTHRQLLTEVWGPAFAEQQHYLRVFMGHLRHKIEEVPSRPKHLTTEPGVGYRFRG